MVGRTVGCLLGVGVAVLVGWLVTCWVGRLVYYMCLMACLGWMAGLCEMVCVCLLVAWLGCDGVAW